MKQRFFLYSALHDIKQKLDALHISVKGTKIKLHGSEQKMDNLEENK